MMDVSVAEQIRALTAELTDVLLTKNHDYGNSALQSPLLMPRIGVEWAILVRLGDKIARLKNLLSGTGAQVPESIDDTLMDMAGYCVLLLVSRRQGNTTVKDFTATISDVAKVAGEVEDKNNV